MLKKIISALMLSVIGNISFSQIPNYSFEDWITVGSYVNPDSWGTMNNTTAYSDIFTATKAVPGSPGSSYLKLTSQTIDSVIVNGIAVSGVLDSLTLTPKSGFPFTQRPLSFTGKWQHMIYGTSQGSVSVLLSRWNTISGKRDTVAMAYQKLVGMAMSWANFSLNFVYQSGDFPDTCIIVLKASGINPTQEDYLWVDNLAFSYSGTGISGDESIVEQMKSFPNPANNELEISCSNSFQKGDQLIISDILGNEVFRKTIHENSCNINTSCFANGTYTCRLLNKLDVQYSEDKIIIHH